MVIYNIKAHPTIYSGVNFRSRLEATWAAFFDLIKWNWEYEPYDLNGWTPDFLVTIPCNHSECGRNHKILIEVKPYDTIEQFSGHKCMDFLWGLHRETDIQIPADSSAAFGINPNVTYWEMAHGAGGGIYDINVYFSNSEDLWKKAKNITQWKKYKEQIQIRTWHCWDCNSDYLYGESCTCP